MIETTKSSFFYLEFYSKNEQTIAI